MKKNIRKHIKIEDQSKYAAPTSTLLICEASFLVSIVRTQQPPISMQHQHQHFLFERPFFRIHSQNTTTTNINAAPTSTFLIWEVSLSYSLSEHNNHQYQCSTNINTSYLRGLFFVFILRTQQPSISMQHQHQHFLFERLLSRSHCQNTTTTNINAAPTSTLLIWEACFSYSLSEHNHHQYQCSTNINREIGRSSFWSDGCAPAVISSHLACWLWMMCSHQRQGNSNENNRKEYWIIIKEY